MDPTHFDTIAKQFASRTSRRVALKGGGATLAAAALAPFASRVAAQDGAPAVATPVIDPNDPHPSADTATAQPEFLFVQPFDAGACAPKTGKDGVSTLTLTGAAAQTIYFSDRPERIVGLTPNQQFLDGLGFTPDNPPNAALVTDDGSGEHEVLVIELFNPAYEAGAASLTYDARLLADYAGTGLAHLAAQQQDYELAGTFGAGSLFIDACSDVTVNCARGDTIVGQTSVPQYWSTSVPGGMCRPVPNADTYCDNAYTDQCGDLCMAQPTWDD